MSCYCIFVMVDLLVALQVLCWKLLFKVRNGIIFLDGNAHLYVQQVVLSCAEFVMSCFSTLELQYLGIWKSSFHMDLLLMLPVIEKLCSLSAVCFTYSTKE